VSSHRVIVQRFLKGDDQNLAVPNNLRGICDNVTLGSSRCALLCPRSRRATRSPIPLVRLDLRPHDRQCIRRVYQDRKLPSMRWGPAAVFASTPFSPTASSLVKAPAAVFASRPSRPDGSGSELPDVSPSLGGTIGGLPPPATAGASSTRGSANGKG
jgi:hypothetical protein